MATSNPEEKAYMEGFRDGRRAMAASVARRLFGMKSDKEISFITSLSVEELQSLRTEENARRAIFEAEQSELPMEGLTFLRDVAQSGTALVEPSFVRTVRNTLGLTQAALAKKLGVHENTVGSWETSELPVRIRKATYEQLLFLIGEQKKSEG
jgi:ribosome-binding protein aMBF1 (putative translation factor)